MGKCFKICLANLGQTLVEWSLGGPLSESYPMGAMQNTPCIDHTVYNVVQITSKEITLQFQNK